jgi:hypothetical protein
MPVRCNGRKKSYQTSIANKGEILYVYLCFTLFINFESSNLSYDDHTTCIGCVIGVDVKPCTMTSGLIFSVGQCCRCKCGVVMDGIQACLLDAATSLV